MAQIELLFAFSLFAAASAAIADPEAGSGPGAPPGGPGTLYCLHVDPITGSNVQTIQCWTRDEWADQGVDVDKEWPRNGVRTEG